VEIPASLRAKYTKPSNNVIDNEYINNINTNNNDNDSNNKYIYKTNVIDNVDRIADRLVEKLHNPGSRRYYCLVAKTLPENILWSNLELAMRGRSPQRYFTWLCQRSLQEGEPELSTALVGS
jgi:hypothetical protein